MVVLSRFSPEENSLHRSSGGKSSEAVHKSLRLLRTVSEPEFDVDGTEELLRTDLTLSYKLLRYLNSPIFERSRPLNSIRQAIITLGQRPLRQWVSLIAVEELKLLRNGTRPRPGYRNLRRQPQSTFDEPPRDSYSNEASGFRVSAHARFKRPACLIPAL